jgi:hypothetical protein
MLVPSFAARGCQVVSVTDPYGRILGFIDRSRYFFFQVALMPIFKIDIFSLNISISDFLVLSHS